jgi:hypothetical protein
MYIGVNWPDAADTMLPEGLQYQPVSGIVSRIKSAGFNIIRLTFAVEMIDQICDDGGEDIPISTAFTQAPSEANGKDIFNRVLGNNPSWNENTARLQVRAIAIILRAKVAS